VSVGNSGMFLVTKRWVFPSLASLVLIASAAEWFVRKKGFSVCPEGDRAEP